VTDAPDKPEILARLQAIPSLPPWTPETLAVQPLASLSNRSFRLDFGGDSFVLRLPRPGAAMHTDRAAETHNATAAAVLGFAPKLLFFDPRDGTMLTRFVRGAAPLTAADLRAPEVVAAATDLLRRLHTSGCSFRGEMHLFPTLDRYIAMAGADAPAAAEIGAMRRAARPIEAALAARPQPFVPCHVDPTPSNFLAAPDRLYLLDWEYAAMCEPLWDLADLSTEAGFDAEQDEAMLHRYAGEPSPRQRSRFVLLKAMLHLLAAAWAAMQAAHGNDSTDFAAYVLARLNHVRGALADSRLGAHLAQVR
jgi:thiamine kinase-like enzyme